MVLCRWKQGGDCASAKGSTWARYFCNEENGDVSHEIEDLQSWMFYELDLLVLAVRAVQTNLHQSPHHLICSYSSLSQDASGRHGQPSPNLKSALSGVHS